MIESVLAEIRRSESFVVTTHLGPDGDAIGSQLALYHFLVKLGKSCELINADPPPYNLSWLEGSEHIQAFENRVEQLKAIGAADAIIVVDTNAEDRLGSLGKVVRNSSARKILIDHHPDPEGWFDVSLVDVSASSSGEIVFRIMAAHDVSVIDSDIAESLYTAILTDTGSFRFSNVSGDVHRVVAELLDRGNVDPSQIHALLYDRRTLESVRFLGSVLRTTELRYDGKLGFMVVTSRMMRETGVDREDLEGVVNRILTIDGVRVAVFFLETERGIKMSFRSKGDFNVTKWAQSFGGGGHSNASGAFVKGSLDDVVRRVLDSAPQYLPLDPADDDGVDEDADHAYLASLMSTKPASKDV